MSTTFSTSFKNRIIDLLTGRTSSANVPMVYVNFYNGAQAADPATTPAGSLVFGTVSQGPNLTGKWAAADNNATGFMTIPTSAGTPAGAASVSTLTTARFYDGAQTAMIDTSLATAAAGGIGLVVDTLNSSAGVGPMVTATALKMPIDNGSTLFLSTSLARRLVDLCTGVVTISAANIPQMGINTNGACTLSVYSGTVPADADAPLSGNTLLVTFTIGATQLWATASGGSATMSITLGSNTAAATGTATFCRMVKTSGSLSYTIQGSVGAGGSDFVIGTTSIVSGNTYTLTDAVISI